MFDFNDAIEPTQTKANQSDGEIIQQLASLKPIDYDRGVSQAKILGVRPGILELKDSFRVNLDTGAFISVMPLGMAGGDIIAL